MILPEMFKIRQRFDNTCIGNIEAVVKAELDRLGLRPEKGARIAITAGSRGIDNIARVIKACASYVRSLGAEPFIVPAMGSHGGATAEGQTRVLADLGIEPGFVGAPILSSMETVVLEEKQGDGSSVNSKQKNRPLVNGSSASLEATEPSPCFPFPFPIHMDKYAYEADGIIVVNRVKPHTSFHSDIESGMMKMMAVGLGKEVQAANIHSFGTRGLRELIAPVARRMLSTGKIIAGLGLVENAYDKLMEVRAYLPEEIESGERKLLAKARRSMPCLPVDKIDLLVVDELGKNYSGTGMDTNIIGRLRIEGEPEPEKPRIKRIAVLDLSSGSNGNAYGIGLADFTTKKLADKIDYKATYANALTTGFIERAKIPVIAANDTEAAIQALRTCALKDAGAARIVRISNTLQLEYISVSKSIYMEIKDSVDTV